MPLTRPDPKALWSTAIWLLIIVAASVGFSRAFACATPFVALATLAGTQLRWREGAAAVVLVWLTNQAIGFFLLGYPHTMSTYAWGAAIGLAALAALAIAAAAGRRSEWPVAHLAMAFVAAFIGFETLLYATALILRSGTATFGPAIVGRIFAINVAAFLGLLALHKIAVGTGLRLPAPASQHALP